MFFNSPVFLFLFLPVVLAGYYLVPFVLRRSGSIRGTILNLFLFLASIFFYAWGEKLYVQVLLYSWIINYVLASWVALAQARGYSGRLPLYSAIVVNLGLLGYFKYAGFLVTNVSSLSTLLGGPHFHPPTTHLPIGVSFFTFQALSYVIDVYRKDVPVQRNALTYGLYVFLFPHLIAGPIVRYADISGQLLRRSHSVDQFSEGVHRLVQGLGKKLLIADHLAQAVDSAFLFHLNELTTATAWLVLVCYSLQIYFDFSGYSDMAIGLGKMFGFDFLENFRHPYAAESVTDFWRRWHISLSSWFRDYVYIPLGGNRCGTFATYRNLFIVFILCGLWHGANWTFIIWGAWHGLFLVLERAGLGSRLVRAPLLARRLYTLLAVMGGWVFFRVDSLTQAGQFFAVLAGQGTGTYVVGDLFTPVIWVALAAGLILSQPVGPWLTQMWNKTISNVSTTRQTLAEALALPVKAVALATLMVATGMALAGSTYSSFIYFRF